MEPNLREQTLAWLWDNVPAARVQHVLGVEQMSVELACHYGLDAEKARIAGLMHDLAKYVPPPTLLQMARDDGLDIDEVAAANPHLLHADASAIVARDRFGIRDRTILAAIANHTLGRPEMDDLSCVVFVADALEPNRGDTPELNAMRRACWENLYQGVRQTCDHSLQYLIRASRTIHPRAVATRNWALARAKASAAIADPSANSRFEARPQPTASAPNS